MKQTVIVQVK